MSSKPDAVRKMIAAQLDELEQIVVRAGEDGEWSAAFERLSRWKDRTVRLLGQHVNATEAERLAGKRMMSFAMGDPYRNVVDEARMYGGFLEALDEQVAAHPEDLLDLPVPAQTALAEIEIPAPTGGSTVFIIHGHDELNLLRLKELLKDRWHLDPVVLSARPGAGRTLIEKFEQEAQGAAFALALMTPDDLVAVEDQGYGQARPNVTFELGWFYGRLGRARVCILLRQGTRLHSDLDGISRIEFNESVVDVMGQLENELKAAGILTA